MVAVLHRPLSQASRQAALHSRPRWRSLPWALLCLLPASLLLAGKASAESPATAVAAPALAPPAAARTAPARSPLPQPSGAALLQGDDPLVIGPSTPGPAPSAARPADLGEPATAAPALTPAASAEPSPASPPAAPGQAPPAAASAGATPDTSSPSLSRPATTLLPAPAPLARELVLERGHRLLKVIENGQVVHRFPVAVGMPGWETPVGRFTVMEMTRFPVWVHPQSGNQTPPGPANPLGSRWIGFHRDCSGRRGWDGDQMLDLKGCVMAGFHGTPHRWTVGRAVSHGCVRLYEEDVKLLFDLVSLGTPVTVVP